jgi:hypothetical protein
LISVIFEDYKTSDSFAMKQNHPYEEVAYQLISLKTKINILVWEDLVIWK